MSYTRTLITIKDAAKMLGLAESTVRGRKAGTHKLTRIKYGIKSVRLISQQVEAQVEKLIKEGKKRA
jgi:hypothetical protein